MSIAISKTSTCKIKCTTLDNKIMTFKCNELERATYHFKDTKVLSLNPQGW